MKLDPANSHEHNRHAWNRLAKSGSRFAQAASDSDFADPLAFVDGPGWLGHSISGKRVLCLAAGGGRQGPIYAAAGGVVTVVDISHEMLEIDRQVAQKRNLSLRTVEGSMDNLSHFDDATFDIVIHPVSTCYVSDVQSVFNEVARVTIEGGIYISQHKQPISLQSSILPQENGYVVQHPFHRTDPLPPSRPSNLVREDGTQEYVHSLAELLGGICNSGFNIAALTEPVHADPNAPEGSFKHRSNFIPPYIRIKAIRNSLDSTSRQKIWSPE